MKTYRIIIEIRVVVVFVPFDCFVDFRLQQLQPNASDKHTRGGYIVSPRLFSSIIVVVFNKQQKNMKR